MMGMRKRRARIARKASASLLAILLASVLVAGCGGEDLDAVKARMGQLLAEQSELRQFLEIDFYGIGEDVEILTPPPTGASPPGTVILWNGKLDIPAGVSDRVRAALTEYEPQIAAVFREFGCDSLELVGGPRHIIMGFGTAKLNGVWGVQWLSYPSSSTSGLWVVFKDWYYNATPLHG